MQTKILLLILFPYIGFPTSFAQEIKISNKLALIKLSSNTYLHTGENNNGILFIDGGEAVLISTPESEKETQHLIDYIRKDLNATVIGCIIDRWHPDAMGGIAAVKQSGIKTYSYELTRTIAKKKGLSIPEFGFDPLLELTVGKEKIIGDFLGPAHTEDGIVVWIPKDQILFGGNEIRELGSWYGNIGDANLKEWSNTVRKVKEKYGTAQLVIPGHGKHGGPELLDYTIRLYSPSKWGPILKANKIHPAPVFNDFDYLFETAESDTPVGNERHLNKAIVFVNHSDKYLKVQSQKIVHNIDKKMISSDFGQLQIYDKETNELLEDLFYKQLYVHVREDAVGWTIILKEAIR